MTSLQLVDTRASASSADRPPNACCRKTRHPFNKHVTPPHTYIQTHNHTHTCSSSCCMSCCVPSAPGRSFLLPSTSRGMLSRLGLASSACSSLAATWREVGVVQGWVRWCGSWSVFKAAEGWTVLVVVCTA